MLAEKLMLDDAKDIIKVVVEAPKGGDMTAARLILERIAPVKKGRPVYLDLPPVRNAEDIDAAMEALTTAMASGEVTPDEAATVASSSRCGARHWNLTTLQRASRRWKGRHRSNEERPPKARRPARSQVWQENPQSSQYESARVPQSIDGYCRFPRRQIFNWGLVATAFARGLGITTMDLKNALAGADNRAASCWVPTTARGWTSGR